MLLLIYWLLDSASHFVKNSLCEYAFQVSVLRFRGRDLSMIIVKWMSNMRSSVCSTKEVKSMARKLLAPVHFQYENYAWCSAAHVWMKYKIRKMSTRQHILFCFFWNVIGIMPPGRRDLYAEFSRFYPRWIPTRYSQTTRATWPPSVVLTCSWGH